MATPEVLIVANPGFSALNATLVESTLHSARAQDTSDFSLGCRRWLTENLPVYGGAVDEAFAFGIRRHGEDTTYAARSGLLLASRVIANLVEADDGLLVPIQNNVSSHFPANSFLYGVNDSSEKIRSMFKPELADSFLQIRHGVARSFCIAGLRACLFNRRAV